jgi:hypothetical protein
MSITAKDVTRTVCEYFLSQRLIPRTEYRLPNGRRLDVAAIGGFGWIAGVEVKIDVRDYNRDMKWSYYIDYCKIFYFAVPLGFQYDVIPRQLGLIVSNGTVAKVVRGASQRDRITPGGLLRA